MHCNTAGPCEPRRRRLTVSGKVNTVTRVYGTCAGRSSRARWVFLEQVFWSACWGPELRRSLQPHGRPPAPTSSAERWRSPDSPATPAHTASTPLHTDTRERACSDKCYYTRFTNTISLHRPTHMPNVLCALVCVSVCLSLSRRALCESEWES